MNLASVCDAQCTIGTNAALGFDGVNDITYVPQHPVVSGLWDFTIEFLVRTSQRSSATPILISKWRGNSGTSNDDTFSVRMQSSGVVTVQLATGNTWAWGATGSLAVNDGAWRHVAVSRRGTVVTIYVDGQPDGAGTFAGLLNWFPTPITFGNGLFYASETPGATTWFDGDMDEIRIWSVARTQGQIAAMRTVGLLGTESGLIGYWRMDEDQGSQSLFNSAAATGRALDGSLWASLLANSDDPTRLYANLSSMPYCRPCPNPPCGQANSTCASLVVNGIGTGGQGPFGVTVPRGGSVSFQWSGPANQPWVLIGSSNLVPGQALFAPTFVVDLNLSSTYLWLSGLSPGGALFFTGDMGTGYGASTFSITVPGSASGGTMHVQGIVLDSANLCSGGLGMMSTASFSILL
ncbi:MAG: LamG domain-containing protein [Planctomycetes bacterium]|nr:LamG domain-containing protein [Planctomycetota bacterium]